MNRWMIIFKALSNINRLKIIVLLSGEREMNVGDIAAKLNISLTATSNHLVILQKLDVLGMEGKAGHVFYFLNRNMPKDFGKALKLFCGTS
ncbi:MAG TPA: metalloregulator ArsR/SmtB family transcription factor [Candidatus Paceibacterota bacterium]